MDSSERLVPRCGNSSTAAQEVLWNLQMTVPAVKQEEIEITYEGGSQYSDSMASMYPSDPIQSSEYVNYYDSKDSVFKQVKKEFPDEEYPQSSDSMNSKEVIENNELLNHWDKHKVKNENTGDGLLNIKEEVVDIDYPYSRNTVWIQEQRMLTNDGDASTHYDALLTPREVECQPSGTALKYSEMPPSCTQQSSKTNRRVNERIISKREASRRYREKHREEINQRRRENRKNRRNLQSIDASSKQAKKGALRKERDRRYWERNIEKIKQRRKENRQKSQYLQPIATASDIQSIDTIKQNTEQILDEQRSANCIHCNSQSQYNIQ